MANSGAYVEDEIGRKFDRCMTDTVIKFASGLLLGGVFSLLFFRRSKWPLVLGSGFGIGMAYSNCERDINSTVRSPALKAKDTRC